MPVRQTLSLPDIQLSYLEWNQVDIPTLFIQSEKGVNRKDWQLKPYKTYLKNLRIGKVPGNHWPFLVQPEAFNQTVKTFLEEQREHGFTPD